MQRRRAGTPHKGWRDSARKRYARLDRHVLGNLCSCTSCVLPLAIECAPAVSDEQVFCFLDTLPRAQWSHADVMVRARFGLGKDRAVTLAKDWLRAAIIKTQSPPGPGEPGGDASTAGRVGGLSGPAVESC